RELRGPDRGRAHRERHARRRQVSASDGQGPEEAQGPLVQRRKLRRVAQAVSAQAARAPMGNDELKRHIADFLRDYSIEITPHDAGKLDAIRAELADGTAVYVAHPPGVPIDDIVSLAGQVQKLGLKATPHIIARKLESREQLEKALAQCQELGIRNALCVAGDITAEKPAFNSSLEVLQTGLFAKYGFKQVGV